MQDELEFAGLSISQKVFETVVGRAAQRVEGVAGIGAPAAAGSLLGLLSGSPAAPQVPSVGVRQGERGVEVAVHLTVFFGYPFRVLADQVRAAVAEDVETFTGLSVASVDVFIDAVVFPKE